MQDFSQLKKDYGREQADVIVNITGNIISGQVMGETAKLLSERFGKIMQDKESISINRNDTSISRSTQMDHALPASKISNLSSGEFVGLVADNPDEKIKLKMFHSEIINETEKLNAEIKNYLDIPVVTMVTQQQVMDNYYQVKVDVKRLIEEEVGKLKEEKERQEMEADKETLFCNLNGQPMGKRVSNSRTLLQTVKALIAGAQHHIVRNVNTTMLATYYEIGRMIVEEEQEGKERAAMPTRSSFN